MLTELSYAFLVFCLLVLPVRYLCTILHELGHYLACRLQGYAPLYVNLGEGKTWYQFCFRGTWFHLNQSGSSGEVFVAPGHLKQMRLWGSIFFFAAEPLCHLLAVTGIIFIGTVDGLPSALSAGLWLLGLHETHRVLMQIIPIRIHEEVDGKSIEYRSDGFNIRNMWRRRHQFNTIKENW